ncbi:uncharacterized protein BX664DRAFT_333781 [Halteromyces radiatus]|uniref:uncharacterized protein n=1 Tax=Halteromyces radiatus TaxID=101107 RepID=UPI00221EC170|nr:uncharacterized protein BX664DRAFT_333781 [Halteromyces radiatus]KAI8089739.1 hypothetical protein BX664DRAFT_333781 [Halteromyces radiatus]
MCISSMIIFFIKLSKHIFHRKSRTKVSKGRIYIPSISFFFILTFCKTISSRINVTRGNMCIDHGLKNNRFLLLLMIFLYFFFKR